MPKQNEDSYKGLTLGLVLTALTFLAICLYYTFQDTDIKQAYTAHKLKYKDAVVSIAITSNFDGSNTSASKHTYVTVSGGHKYEVDDSLKLNNGQTVKIGTKDGKLVTVNDEFVYKMWSFKKAVFYALLPTLFFAAFYSQRQEITGLTRTLLTAIVAFATVVIVTAMANSPYGMAASCITTTLFNGWLFIKAKAA